MRRIRAEIADPIDREILLCINQNMYCRRLQYQNAVVAFMPRDTTDYDPLKLYFRVLGRSVGKFELSS
jgi:hypothetical protein